MSLLTQPPFCYNMAVKRATVDVFIILHLITIFATSVPLNSTILSLPQSNHSVTKPGTWPPGLTLDDVPGKEDISLIINPHQNLPKHPSQIDQDANDLDALIRILTATMKPNRAVAPKSH